MTPHTRIALSLTLAALVLCVLCPLLSGVAYMFVQENLYPASLPDSVSANVETAEAGYYRGVYDVCVYFYTGTGGGDAEAVTECNGFVDRIEGSAWFALESKGYEK